MHSVSPAMMGWGGTTLCHINARFRSHTDSIAPQRRMALRIGYSDATPRSAAPSDV